MKKEYVMGNGAIALGALAAGVNLAAGYPGTPSSEIIETLRKMDFYKISGIGYMPCYKRTQITDALHAAFDFRTDKVIITDKRMKKIIKDTKK